MLSVVFVRDKKKEKRINEMTAVTLALFVVWQLITTKLNLLDSSFFPSPSVIFSLFTAELPHLVNRLLSFMHILFPSYILALIVAIPLALVIGIKKRFYRIYYPVAKMLAATPLIIYFPYAGTLVMTCKTILTLIIFLSVFWIMFISTLRGIFRLDKNIIDRAKKLSSVQKTTVYQVILPEVFPFIMYGMVIALVFSFVLLITVEMNIGSSGFGGYIKECCLFSDYPRIIIGIIFIEILAAALIIVCRKTEDYLMKRLMKKGMDRV